MIYGARYIDLRVGYYDSNREPWWGNHGVVKLHPLRVIFNDIREFLNNTKEIVILDIQEFPVGMYTNIYLKIITEKFKKILYRFWQD